MPYRVLMISTNRELSPQPVAPIGAAWVAEALSQAGFKVLLLDLSFEKDPLKKVGLALKHFRPEGIGLSVRNIDNGDFLSPKSFLEELKALTDYIKQNSAAPILIGGSGVSIMPRALLGYLGLDHAVVGDGEAAAVRFFKARGEVGSCEVPGVVCRDGAEKDEEPSARFIDPGLVRPRMHHWVNIGRYLRYEPVLPVQGKRGCSNNCIYCTYNNIEGRRYRLRQPEEVAEEISAAIQNTGARTFEFVDSIFNMPDGYIEALLEEIIRWRLKARFHVSSMSPRGLTKEHVKLMEKAGITAVGITPDSAAGPALESLRKGFGEDEVNRAAELIAASKINALWCFLLGGPGEDENTLKTTVKFINSKIAKKDKAFIAAGVRIYPGTGMHALAVKEGVVKQDDDLLAPRFYFSPKLSPRQARDILRGGLDSPGSSLFLSDTHAYSLAGLRLIGTAFRLPSPFWRYAGYMNVLLTGKRVINRDWS